MRRLAASVSGLYGLALPPALDRDLDRLPHRGRALVRVSVWPRQRSLDSKIEVEPHRRPRRPPRPELIPVTITGGLGCHKWRDRSWLEHQRRQHACGPDRELLLLDERGEVLETERAAVLIIEGGSLVAMPDDGRRLPSLTRRRAMAVAAEVGFEVRVEAIGLERLLAADQVLSASSVRQLVAAEACGDRRWGLTDTADRLVTAAAGALGYLR